MSVETMLTNSLSMDSTSSNWRTLSSSTADFVMASSVGINMSSWARNAMQSDAVERVARDKRVNRWPKAVSDMAVGFVPIKQTNLSSEAGCGDATMLHILLRR